MSSDPFVYLVLSVTAISISNFPIASCCMVEYCSEMYSRRIDEGHIITGSNAPYCQLITDYGYCLQATSRSCRGNLKFHTLQTLLKRQGKEFACDRFPETLFPSHEQKPKCNSLGANTANVEFRFCSVFGSRHMRTFNGRFVTCTQPGAFPIIENRFFLIQVTRASLKSGVNAFTEVSVLVRPWTGCTDRKLYVASSDEDNLPESFVDGTIFGKTDANDAVLIERLNSSSVQISLNFIATTIVVRRHGGFLAVAVRLPEIIVKESIDDNDQLCSMGCLNHDRLRLEDILANPESFARCYAINIITSESDAENRCSSIGVTDAFFDACVFDTMLMGNMSVAEQYRDAQQDILRLYPPYSLHYLTGRTNTSLYRQRSTFKWEKCPSSLSVTVYWSTSLLMFLSVLTLQSLLPISSLLL